LSQQIPDLSMACGARKGFRAHAARTGGVWDGGMGGRWRFRFVFYDWGSGGPSSRAKLLLVPWRAGGRARQAPAPFRLGCRVQAVREIARSIPAH
jgi:hypothetical protein